MNQKPEIVQEFVNFGVIDALKQIKIKIILYVIIINNR